MQERTRLWYVHATARADSFVEQCTIDALPGGQRYRGPPVRPLARHGRPTFEDINRTVVETGALHLDHLSAKLAAMACAIVEVFMGDKSPKSKQKDDKQKQAQSKNDAAKAQAKQQPKAQAPAAKKK